jgi:hypothetical protein
MKAQSAIRTQFNPTCYYYKLYPSQSELQLEDINVSVTSTVGELREMDEQDAPEMV